MPRASPSNHLDRHAPTTVVCKQKLQSIFSRTFILRANIIAESPWQETLDARTGQALLPRSWHPESNCYGEKHHRQRQLNPSQTESMASVIVPECHATPSIASNAESFSNMKDPALLQIEGACSLHNIVRPCGLQLLHFIGRRMDFVTVKEVGELVLPHIKSTWIGHE